MGWATQGLWPDGGAAADAPIVTAVARAHSASAPVIASVNTAGQVSLQRFPAAHPQARSKVGHGHGENGPTNCCFTAGDQFLVTCGGSDSCVFQHRLLMHDG
jgi:hypothetical protein